MSVSFVNKYLDNGGASENASLDGSGADRLILAGVSASDSALRTLNSMTVDGVSIADIINTGIDGGKAGFHCFGHILDADNPGAGGATMVPSWSGSAGSTIYSLIELAGVDQTTPMGEAAVNTATTVDDGGAVSVTLEGHSGKFALVFVVTGSTTSNDGSGGHGLPAAATLIDTWAYINTRVSLGYISAVASASEALEFTVSADGSSTVDSVVVGAIPVYAVGEVPAADTTPDAFSFTDQTDVTASSTITSAAITVAGVAAATDVAITVTGGTYDINESGTFVSTAGVVQLGDTVRARHPASASDSTAVNTTVTIGGISDTFTSTTAAAPSFGITSITPDTVEIGDEFVIGFANGTGPYTTALDGQALTLDSQDANSGTVSAAPSPLTFGDKSLTFNVAYDVVATDDNADEATDQITFEPTGQYTLISGSPYPSTSVLYGSSAADGDYFYAVWTTGGNSQTLPADGDMEGLDLPVGTHELEVTLYHDFGDGYETWGTTATIDLTVTEPSEAPVITGFASASVPENSLVFASGAITNRNDELPTLSGVDAALFDIELLTGNSFQIVPVGTIDYDAPTDDGTDQQYDVTINIDNLVDTAVTADRSYTVTNVNEATITDGGDLTVELDYGETGLAKTDPLFTDWLATYTGATSNDSGDLDATLAAGSSSEVIFSRDDADDVIGTFTITVADPVFTVDTSDIGPITSGKHATTPDTLLTSVADCVVTLLDSNRAVVGSGLVDLDASGIPSGTVTVTGVADADELLCVFEHPSGVLKGLFELTVSAS